MLVRSVAVEAPTMRGATVRPAAGSPVQVLPGGADAGEDLVQTVDDGGGDFRHGHEADGNGFRLC